MANRILTETWKHIRALELRRVLRSRNECQQKHRIRNPELNFAANDYIDLIDWQNVTVTEPPVISTLSTANLEEFIASESVPTLDFPEFSLHTQSRELMTSFYTEAEFQSEFNQ